MYEETQLDLYLRELEKKFAGVRSFKYISALIIDVDCISDDVEHPFRDYCENADEIRAFMQFLKDNQVCTAVVSESSEDEVRRVLADAGLAESFDCVMQCEKRNPKAPIEDITFIKACALMDVSPKETYVLTRSEEGVHAVCDGRMHAIGMSEAGGTHQMKKLAELILPSLCSVKDYLNVLLS